MSHRLILNYLCIPEIPTGYHVLSFLLLGGSVYENIVENFSSVFTKDIGRLFSFTSYFLGKNLSKILNMISDNRHICLILDFTRNIFSNSSLITLTVGLFHRWPLSDWGCCLICLIWWACFLFFWSSKSARFCQIPFLYQFIWSCYFSF